MKQNKFLSDDKKEMRFQKLKWETNDKKQTIKRLQNEINETAKELSELTEWTQRQK